LYLLSTDIDETGDGVLLKRCSSKQHRLGKIFIASHRFFKVWYLLADLGSLCDRATVLTGIVKGAPVFQSHCYGFY